MKSKAVKNLVFLPPTLASETTMCTFIVILGTIQNMKCIAEHDQEHTDHGGCKACLKTKQVLGSEASYKLFQLDYTEKELVLQFAKFHFFQWGLKLQPMCLHAYQRA